MQLTISYSPTVGIPLVTPTLSPHIGDTNYLTTVVPVSVASGFISFSLDSITRSVSEPDSGFQAVSLTVVRTGEFGNATVVWSAAAASGSSFSADDVIVSVATVTISNGKPSFPLSLSVYLLPTFDSLVVSRAELHSAHNFSIFVFKGLSEAQFDVLISADTIAELDEAFEVKLLTVSESNQQLADTMVQ